MTSQDWLNLSGTVGLALLISTLLHVRFNRSRFMRYGRRAIDGIVLVLAFILVTRALDLANLITAADSRTMVGAAYFMAAIIIGDEAISYEKASKQ